MIINDAKRVQARQTVIFPEYSCERERLAVLGAGMSGLRQIPLVGNTSKFKATSDSLSKGLVCTCTSTTF